MNDPNGMVYYNREYHLFYQYYPDSTVWGPMHWGHAVSKDMVHWEHLPVALYPDNLGYIFSGSAVVDVKNTSGLGTIENPPLVAIFTHHNPERERAGADDFQNQSLAFSLDNGRTWEKYSENPVLSNVEHIRDFRDPKVFWYDEESKWVMILAVKDHIELYESSNLKKWSYMSEFGRTAGAHGGVWECPDLFPLTSNTSETKWVMLVSINPGGPMGGSATQYFVGDFDGKAFNSYFGSHEYRWLDSGTDNYAGVSWSNIPKEDGRRLFLGWMSNWNYAQVVPSEKWRSAMTLPRRLDLKYDRSKKWTVTSNPVKELDKLRDESTTIQKRMVAGEADFSEYIQTGTFYLNLELIRIEKYHDFEIEISNDQQEKVNFGYVYKSKAFFFDRSRSGETGFSEEFSRKQEVKMVPKSDTVKLEIFVDHSSIEIFANDGAMVMSEIAFPKTPYTNFRLITKDQPLLINAEIANLKSIWEKE